MNYREAYRELAVAILDFGMVIDFSYFGCASRSDRSEVLIVVNPALSWRNRLFTLAHETGHLFRLEKEKLVPAKRVAGEALANRRAIKLLAWVLEEDVSAAYSQFYNKVMQLPKPLSWGHL